MDHTDGQETYGEEATSSASLDGASPQTATQHPDQEHPVQDAHGGSMAPAVVDDTGHLVGESAPIGDVER